MSKRVILIEDDIDTRTLLKKALKDAGLLVEDLPDGRNLVNYNFPTPDLFIIDNCMPMIDGIALTKYLRIKKQTQNVPVLMISAKPDFKEKAHRSGASEFISKPFNINNFLTVVASLLTDPENTKLEGEYRKGA